MKKFSFLFFAIFLISMANTLMAQKIGGSYFDVNADFSTGKQPAYSFFYMEETYNPECQCLEPNLNGHFMVNNQSIQKVFYQAQLNGNTLTFNWVEYHADDWERTNPLNNTGTGTCVFSGSVESQYFGIVYSKAILTINAGGKQTTYNLKFLDFGCLFSQSVITLSDYSLKQVSELAVGDELLSYNLMQQSFETTVVTEIEVSPSPRTQLNFTLIPLETEASLDAQENTVHLQTTAGHIIYTTQGNKKAQELQVGDIVVLVNGEQAYLQTITIVEMPEAEKVYNPLTNNKPYFANGVLVLPK